MSDLTTAPEATAAKPWRYTLGLHVEGTVHAVTRDDAEAAALEDAREWLAHEPWTIAALDVREDTSQ